MKKMLGEKFFNLRTHIYNKSVFAYLSELFKEVATKDLKSLHQVFTRNLSKAKIKNAP